ncbi:hypothetical protein FKM82_001097 [Ascaphus truei]
MDCYYSVVCCFILFTSAYGDCISELYQDVYFQGGDHGSVFAPDVDYCQLVCTFSPRCLMFSYLPANWPVQNERFSCFLKDSATGILPKLPLPGSTSGHSLKHCNNKINACSKKIHTALDMIGTNYNITTVANVEKCKEQCTNDVHCQFFTYVTEAFHSVQLRNKCYFKYTGKGTPTRIRQLDNVVSGFSLKACGESSLGCQSDLFQSMELYGDNITAVFAPDVHTCRKICTYYPNCLFFTFLTKDWTEPLQSLRRPQIWNVYGGIVKQSSITPATPFFEVEQIIIHPLYTGSEYGNDIALLKLKTHIPYNDYQQAICLPPKQHSFKIPTFCWITGWGFTEEKGSPSNVLQKAEVPLISNEECQASYQHHNITNQVLCAGYKHGQIDACKGDSGGPLTCNIDKTWYIFGVTSWGEGCARPGKPGVYTRVSEFTDWILENTKVTQK